MRSERRLHPAAAVERALASLREALLPVIVGFIFSGGGSLRALLFAVLAVAGAAVAGYVRWTRTAYWVSDDALHFRSGVFSPNEKVVPLARITAFDEVRGPVQRLFAVVALHVQTAGGGKEGEIVLSAVTQTTAAELRALVTDGQPVPEQEPDARWRLGFGALVVAAATGPQLGVVAPVVGGVMAIASQSLAEEEGLSLVQRIEETAGGWVMLAVLVAAATLLLALAGAIVGFGGFVVERRGRRLHLQRGYVQRRAASLDVGRVHAVRIVEGALRRPFGLCSIRLEVAGYADEPAVAQTLVPLCRRSDARAILARLVVELPLPPGAPGRPPLRALPRFLWPALLPAATGGAVILLITGVWAVAAVLIIAGALLGVARFRAAGWWLTDTTVAVRSVAMLAHTTTVALTHRLQDAILLDTLTGRRAGLASVGFTVASEHEADVRHLAAADAHRLFARLRRGALGRGVM